MTKGMEDARLWLRLPCLPGFRVRCGVNGPPLAIKPCPLNKWPQQAEKAEKHKNIHICYQQACNAENKLPQYN